MELGSASYLDLLLSILLTFSSFYIESGIAFRVL